LGERTPQLDLKRRGVLLNNELGFGTQPSSKNWVILRFYVWGLVSRPSMVEKVEKSSNLATFPTSKQLESWIIRETIPQIAARFRLVIYCN